MNKYAIEHIKRGGCPGCDQIKLDPGFKLKLCRRCGEMLCTGCWQGGQHLCRQCEIEIQQEGYLNEEAWLIEAAKA